MITSVEEMSMQSDDDADGRDRLAEELEAQGYRVKLAGG